MKASENEEFTTLFTHRTERLPVIGVDLDPGFGFDFTSVEGKTLGFSEFCHGIRYGIFFSDIFFDDTDNSIHPLLAVVSDVPFNRRTLKCIRESGQLIVEEAVKEWINKGGFIIWDPRYECTTDLIAPIRPGVTPAFISVLLTGTTSRDAMIGSRSNSMGVSTSRRYA